MPNTSLPAAQAPAAATPVCVDLDGTLVAGDLLWESFVILVRQRPWTAMVMLFSLFGGRARFKQRVASLVPVDGAALAYRPEVLRHLYELRRTGAPLVLVTASDQRYARAVAGHLELFDDILASDGRTNLRGQSKAASLVARYGRGAFEYIGNDWSDLHVWRAAAGATVVAASPSLARHVASGPLGGRVLSTRPSWWRSIVRALRPHQWSKNLLVFVPVIAAHTAWRLDLLQASLVAFVAFSACASAVYIINDILDIQADRQHPRKRNRPFASGELSIPAGCAVAAALLAFSIAASSVVGSWALMLVMLAYVLATSAYSLVLKRKPVADVFTLTGLYVLRIVAGGVATGTPLSSWLLAFALFFFLSLAFVKRYAELMTVSGWMQGRGYNSNDGLWMHSIGTTAGYMAVLVLALYVNAPEVAALYSRPQIIWLLCPLLLYWLTRLWFRAGRQLIHDDPVVEALKDWFSYAVLAAASLIVLAAV